MKSWSCVTFKWRYFSVKPVYNIQNAIIWFIGDVRGLNGNGNVEVQKLADKDEFCLYTDVTTKFQQLESEKSTKIRRQ